MTDTNKVLNDILLNLVHEVSSIRAGKTFNPADYINPAETQIATLINTIVVDELESLDKFGEHRFKTDVYELHKEIQSRIAHYTNKSGGK
jgi:hypothetical protein